MTEIHTCRQNSDARALNRGRRPPSTRNNHTACTSDVNTQWGHVSTMQNSSSQTPRSKNRMPLRVDIMPCCVPSVRIAFGLESAEAPRHPLQRRTGRRIQTRSSSAACRPRRPEDRGFSYDSETRRHPATRRPLCPRQTPPENCACGLISES